MIDEIILILKVNFPFLDGDIPCSPSYGIYIFELSRFARVYSNESDFNYTNQSLTATK